MVEKSSIKKKFLETEHALAQPERWRANQLFQLVENNLRKSEKIDRKIKIISGAAANSFATRILRNHREQFQREGSKELASPIPEKQADEEVFSEVLVVDEKYLIEISLNVRRKGSYTDEKNISLPVFLNDKVYVMRTATGQLYVAFDHEDSFLAHKETYQTIEKEEVDPYSAFIQVLKYFSCSGKNSQQFLMEHQKMAESVGLDLGINSNHYGYHGQARLHIYLAGHQPPSDSFADDLLVGAALRKGFHLNEKHENVQEEAALNNQLWEQFWEGLQGDVVLKSLMRMDVNYLPGLYDSKSVKQLVAKVAIAQVYGRTSDLQEIIPVPRKLVFSLKAIAEYVVRLLYLESWEKAEGLDELFFSKPTSYRVKQIAFGLFSIYDKIGFSSIDEALNFLFQYHQITELERDELKNCLDLEQQVASLPRLKEDQALSREAADFLGIYGVNENLFNSTSLLAFQLDADALGAPRTYLSVKRDSSLTGFGLRLEHLSQSITNHFPSYKFRVKNDRSFLRDRRAPFWSVLFGHELGLYRHDEFDLKQMLIEFQTALQVLKSYELIPHEMALTIISFWKNIVDRLNISSETEIDSGNSAKELLYKLEKRITKTHLAHHAHAGEHLKFWLSSSVFLERMRYFWQKIRANGYPLAAHLEQAPAHGGLESSAKNLPLHLVTDRTTRFDKELINLKFYMKKAKELDKNSSAHIAVRMAAIRQYPSRVHCRDHRYEDNYSRTVWFEWEVSAFTKRWIAEHWQEIVGEEEVSYFKNATEIGERIYGIINQEIEDLLAQAFQENNQARRTRILLHAYRLATTIYEFDRIWEKPRVDERVNLNICAWSDNYNQIRDSLRKMIDIASKERVKPPGEIKIKPGQVHCLLGPNMGGKSTVMRQLGFGILAHNQGLPQVGGGFSAADDIFLSSPVGSERQMAGESLFTQGAKELGDIIEAKQIGRHKYLWMLDEFGRRTNARYGQANMMTASIVAAAYEETPKDMALMATHYQSMVRYQPFFQALGLELVFWKVEDFKLKRLEPDEEVKSLAIQAIAKHLPLSEYEDWPDKEDAQHAKNSIGTKEKPVLKSLSREQIAAATRDDLMGASMREKIEFLSNRYNMTVVEAKIFLARYLVPKEVEEKQKIVAAVLAHPQLTEHLKILKEIQEITSFHKRLLEVDWKQRTAMRRNFYKHFDLKKIDYNANIDVFNKQVEVFLNQLVKKANKTMRFGKKLINDVVPNWLDGKGTTYTIVNDILSGNLNRGIYELGAVFSYASQIKSKRENGFGYAQAEFRDEAVFAAEEAWNPNLREEKIVTNSFNYDFRDGRAGVVTTGENGSGKSNHQITVGQIGIEATCLGFGPATKIIAPKNLQVLALTQPVSDTLKESSMGQEVVRRISKAVAVAKHSKNPTLVLLDEPGAPTSETDAHKIIVWLFHKFLKNTNTKLEVSTHCDGLVDALKDKVYFQAFRLLSDQPFKAFVGTADSNALEVAKFYGMDETFYDIAKIVHEFIVFTQSDKNLIKLHAQVFADRIKEILVKRVFVAEAQAQVV